MKEANQAALKRLHQSNRKVFEAALHSIRDMNANERNAVLAVYDSYYRSRPEVPATPDTHLAREQFVRDYIANPGIFMAANPSAMNSEWFSTTVEAAMAAAAEDA